MPMIENRRNLDTFIAVIRSVLEDSTFKIKFPVASERKAAVDLLAWYSSESSVEQCYLFTTALIKDLTQLIYSFM